MVEAKRPQELDRCARSKHAAVLKAAVLLTRKGTDALVHLERLLDEASHALMVQDRPPGALGTFGGDNDGANPVTVAR